MSEGDSDGGEPEAGPSRSIQQRQSNGELRRRRLTNDLGQDIGLIGSSSVPGSSVNGLFVRQSPSDLSIIGQYCSPCHVLTCSD